MMTYQMVDLADQNGKTYVSKYGTYNKVDGFKCDPIEVLNVWNEDDFETFVLSLFHDDLWKLKVERKKMTQEEIEKALGYKIEITDVAQKDDHMKNMGEVLNKIFDNLY